MEKEFVNPTVPLKAIIAELRKEVKYWKRKFDHLDKRKDRIIAEKVKNELTYAEYYHRK